MSRTRKAFIIAPLWVPLLVAPISAIYLFPYAAQVRWVVIATVLSAIFAYLGTFTLGWPLFAFLKARQWTASWVAVGSGMAIGAVAWVAFLICFALFLGEGLEAIVTALHPNLSQVAALAMTGGVGALVGGTLWAISRPDQPNNS